MTDIILQVPLVGQKVGYDGMPLMQPDNGDIPDYYNSGAGNQECPRSCRNKDRWGHPRLREEI